MSSSLLTLADSGLVLVGLGIILFGTYRAFASLKVLTEPSYRSLAVWTGVLGIILIPVEVNYVRQELGLAGSVTSAYEILGPIPVLAYAGVIVVFALLDRTIHLGLDLDFFHRDIFLWQKGGRWVVWPVAFVSVTVYSFVSSYYGLLGLYLAIIYAVVVLGVSVSRAHESAILDYIKWLVVTLVGSLGATAVATFTGLNFLQILQGYFFYRVAGSLSGSTYHSDLAFHISAPRDYVYSVYTDPEMLTKITTSYTSAKVEEKLPDGGDVVSITFRALGMNIAGKLVRRYSPPSGMEEDVTTPSGDGATQFRFLEEDGGTKVTVSIDFEPKGALTKFFGGLGARQARGQLKRDFATGKAYCEANRPKLAKD